MPTQNVNLTNELDSFVKKQISSGYFNNASEVHRAALATMCKQEEIRKTKLDILKAEVQKGVDSIHDGDVLRSGGDIRSAIRNSLKKVVSGQAETV